MNEGLFIFLLVFSVLCSTTAYGIGLKLGREKALLDLSVRTSATLNVLAQGWDLLDAKSRFHGLLENVIDLHRWANSDHEAFPIQNLRDTMRRFDES